MTERKIDVYPFYGREVMVEPTGERFLPNQALGFYVEIQWLPKKAAGWKNSWIPMVARINCRADDVTIYAAAMTYAQTYGCVEAIRTGQQFAPKAINNLSIGVIPVTKDDCLMISRRNRNLPHAPGMWNFNGGYMTSMLIDRENCHNNSFIRDPRLYDIHGQLERRIHRQEFVGLQPEDISSMPNPLSLAFGFYHSLEMELGWVIRLEKTRKELLKHIREYKIKTGKEHDRVDFLPLEDLGILLKNQGELLGEDPIKYETEDPRRVILLDCNIGELVGGGFRELTGEALTPSVIEYLRGKGLEVRILGTNPGKIYHFPTSF